MAATLSVEKSLTLAKQAAKKQDWQAAVHLNKLVLDRFPKNKKAQKAVAELRAGAIEGLLQEASRAELEEDWAKASDQLAAAHYLRPKDKAIGRVLSNSYLELDMALKALNICEPLLSASPDDLELLVLMGRILHHLDRPEEAIKILNHALTLHPEGEGIRQMLGLVAQSQGRVDEALSHFEQGLIQNPHDISLLRLISVLKRKVTPDDPQLAQMRQALAKHGANNSKAAFLHFALFDMLHKCEDYSTAFTHLQKGNALIAEQHPFDFKSEAVVGAFSKTLFPEPMEPVDRPETPRFIFVLGLPRSGTTLTERILARDETVQAGGELAIVKPAVFEQLHSIRSLEDKRLTSKHITTLRERLLQGYAEVSDGRPVIVDKMPLNFRWIGYICAALPDARIVHMNRDPRAVAWSLYRQTFRGRGQDFIYTPEDIARFMVFHADLMRHWRKIVGNRIIDLNYSDLVNDQTETTQSLAKALGLSWSEAWLSPEKAETHVRTASVNQVTQPIYQNSDDGWKTYETQLQPMMKALKTAGVI